MTTDIKTRALATFLKIDPGAVEPGPYDRDSFEADGGEYLVLTDDEAEQRAAEQIEESLWAFNTSFLEAHTDLDASALKALDKARETACESANPLVKGIIRDLPHFIDDAIKADGRGHFLSGYDGEENEVKVDGAWFFIYRIN
jgi:hypothetical protein